MISVNYPDLTDRASQFIDTLTCGMFAFHQRRGVFIPGRLACVPQAKPIWALIIKNFLYKNISVRGHLQLTEGDFSPLTPKS